MKNIKSLVFVVGILFLGFLTGCESDDVKDYSVAISFSNATALDSVYSQDSYTLQGKVEAEGPIKMVQFYRNFEFNNGQDSVEISGTKIIPDNTNKCDFAIPVVKVINNTRIRVVVTQNSGAQTSAVYTIKSRPVNINYYQNIQLGGWDSNYGSALDADAGIPYGSSQLLQYGSVVDMFFDNGALWTTDFDAAFYGSHGGVPRFSPTETTYAHTTFTSSDFDSFKGDDTFANMTGTLSSIDIKVGDIIFFQTKSGRKGLLRVNALTDSTGDLMVDLKVQK